MLAKQSTEKVNHDKSANSISTELTLFFICYIYSFYLIGGKESMKCEKEGFIGDAIFHTSCLLLFLLLYKYTYKE